MDAKSTTVPRAKSNKETSNTGIDAIPTPRTLGSIDTDDTKTSPSRYEQCADNLKTEAKLENLDTKPLTRQPNPTKLSKSLSSRTQSIEIADVKPKRQVEVVVRPVSDVLKRPRQMKARHSTSPGIPNGEDTSMSNLSEKTVGDTLDRKKVLESYENPAAQVTVKKEAITLSVDSVYDRIEKVGHGIFDIKAPDDLKSKTITRRFLSDVYGGNMQATFPRPSKSFVEQHGIEQFMCLVKEFNPYAPTLPGAPGLFFGDGEYPKWPRKSERVFTRTGPAEWLYQGDYELARCDSLMPDEYRSLDNIARNTWSKGAISSASWGTATRARIMLRAELDRELKPDKDEARVTTKITFLKNNKHLDTVTAEEVDEAYSSGKEVIAIWAMKCIGYDVEFQRTMMERFNRWVEPESKEKKTSKRTDAKTRNGRGKGGGKASTKSPSKRRRPRSPSIASSDSNGSNDDASYAADSDNEVGAIIGNIRNLGTRSRPEKRARLESEVF